VHHAEDRRVGTDADRQRRNGNGRKSRLLREDARRKAQVLPQRVEKRQAAPLAVRLFRLLHPAEFAPRRVARFFSAHAAPDVFLREKLQVRAQLGIKIFIAAAFAK
jgi:hypothetical protein